MVHPNANELFIKKILEVNYLCHLFQITEVLIHMAVHKRFNWLLKEKWFFIWKSFKTGHNTDMNLKLTKTNMTYQRNHKSFYRYREIFVIKVQNELTTDDRYFKWTSYINDTQSRSDYHTGQWTLHMESPRCTSIFHVM